MFLLVLERSGPEYDLSRPLEEQSGWAEHAAFMDGLVETGFLVLGGPLADELRVAHAVEAESEDAVRTTYSRFELHVPSAIRALTLREPTRTVTTPFVDPRWKAAPRPKPGPLPKMVPAQAGPAYVQETLF